MLLQEHDGGIEVTIIEFVGYAPAQGAELPALLHTAMDEAHSEEQGAPYRGLDPLEAMLGGLNDTLT